MLASIHSVPTSTLIVAGHDVEHVVVWMGMRAGLLRVRIEPPL